MAPSPWVPGGHSGPRCEGRRWFGGSAVKQRCIWKAGRGGVPRVKPGAFGVSVGLGRMSWVRASTPAPCRCRPAGHLAPHTAVLLVSPVVAVLRVLRRPDSAARATPHPALGLTGAEGTPLLRELWPGGRRAPTSRPAGRGREQPGGLGWAGSPSSTRPQCPLALPCVPGPPSSAPHGHSWWPRVSRVPSRRGSGGPGRLLSGHVETGAAVVSGLVVRRQFRALGPTPARLLAPASCLRAPWEAAVRPKCQGLLPRGGRDSASGRRRSIPGIWRTKQQMGDLSPRPLPLPLSIIKTTRK